MSERITLVAITVALAACTGQANNHTLPSQTYHYSSSEGRVTVDSTVVVSRDAGATVVAEEAHFGPGVTTIEQRLDPKTYSVISYAMHNDPEGMDPVITVSPTSAVYRLKSMPRTVARARVPGAPSWVFSDWASSFAVIPSLVHASGTKTINSYYPEVFHKKALASTLWVVDASGARPNGVPAVDASLGLAERTNRKAVISIWFDPTSFVVDAVNIGDGTAFVRKP